MIAAGQDTQNAKWRQARTDVHPLGTVPRAAVLQAPRDGEGRRRREGWVDWPDNGLRRAPLRGRWARGAAWASSRRASDALVICQHRCGSCLLLL
eukprot:364640-Chlamydomonas_euryale.AAC.25